MIVLLQNRLNELNSAILDIKGEKVHITGFTREEMLRKYLELGSDCFSSKGMYGFQELEFHDIKNDALFIVRIEGKEVNRYQYKSVFKDTVQFKEFRDGEEKLVSLTFTIRKSTYSDHYHFLTEKLSLLFENKDQFDKYLLDKFNYIRSY